MKNYRKDLIKLNRYEKSRIKGQMTLSMVFSPGQQVKLNEYGV